MHRTVSLVMLWGLLFAATSASARYYEPSTGRFLQEDPVQLPVPELLDVTHALMFRADKLNLSYADSVGTVQGARHGAVNLYQYAFNSPLNYIDPDGAAPLLVRSVLLVFNGWSNPANAPAVGEQTYSPVITDAELEHIMTLGTLYYGYPLINHNRYFRIGPGRRFGRKTFRMAGQCVEKATGKGHIDFWDRGPL